MLNKEIHFRKKRELGDVITDSFEFLRQEIKPVFNLLLVYVVPFLILYGIVQVYVQKNLMDKIDFTNPDLFLSNLGPFYLNLFFASLFGVFVQALLIATFYSYVEMYIKKGKGNFTVSEITPHLFANGLLALGASLLVYMLVIMGIILCIIPGLYFANTFSLLVFIVLFERKGISQGLVRSWQLVHLQWWNTLLLNILGLVIIYVVSLILSLPSMMMGLNTSFFNFQESGSFNSLPDWYWVLVGISTVVTSLFSIIPSTFLVFQYFNIVERLKPQMPD